MTDEELRAIRARVEAATSGPWHKHATADGFEITGDLPINSIATVVLWEEEDAELIVNAPTDILKLLDEVWWLRVRLAATGGFSEHD